jgi:hypothetical protein
MNRWTVARLSAAVALAAGVAVSAQIQIPGEPARQFGTGVTPSYEGWFDNADGSHTFLIGYLNRNRAQEIDVPIGPNNKVEGPQPGAGGPDMGQPTHFLPGRQVGVFTITVPKEFTPQQRLTWTITVNNQINSIPFKLNVDYNVSPFKDAAVGNTPPVLKFFDEKAAGVQGPIAAFAKSVARAGTVSAGVELPVWVNDDAKYTSGTNAPMRNAPPPVSMTWSKYRGPGRVTFEGTAPAGRGEGAGPGVPTGAGSSGSRAKLETITGGKPEQPFAGKTTITAKFSEPGEYYLLATGNDYSGNGGGGEVCCWTTQLVKITVTP